MANPKSTTQSQDQTQSWAPQRYAGEAESADAEDEDDDIELVDSEGIPSATKDEYRLELDSAGDGEFDDLELVQRANEEIIGDTDGEDYRAGTLDPDGSDRGLHMASSEIIEEDEDGRRNAVGPGTNAGEPGLGDDGGGAR
jgi:hypothetical protein